MTLASLTHPRAGHRMRSSSWDRTGANVDSVTLAPGETHVLLDQAGAGVIRHLWITVNSDAPYYPRELVLRMFWDGAETAAVEAPLGDFFGLGHGKVTSYATLPFSVVTGGRAEARNLAAFNCWFAMPFATGATLAITNDGATPVTQLYYYVDFEAQQTPPAGGLRFHARYRQQRPTAAEVDLADESATWRAVSARVNLDGAGNYLLLDTRGKGHYVGCTLSVDHINPIRGGGWFGEGDDMIFIDGRPGLGAPARPESAPGANDAWPPTLHGTGTEDYFCAAWGFPAGRYQAPFHAVTLAGERDTRTLDYAGKWSMVRFHIADPIQFEIGIRVTIEHGHANCHADDVSSVAYWYQTPVATVPPSLPPLQDRLPRTDLESFRRYLRTR